MDLGICPACARPYTAGELHGLGILRTRPAADGGPLLDFECPGCGRRIRLIPHGEGRYARPGEPPPPSVPAEERIPPWMREGGGTRSAPPPGAAPEPPPAESRPPPEEPPEPIEIPLPPPGDGAWEEGPVTVPEAIQLLGISPTAERGDIEKAFRERSRTCHPDKVAHLDAEFQELAHRKFKRLRAAYELLTS